MDRHRDMQLFAGLVAQPSLAAAARQLQVSGPTLMRAVARLEARLKAPLLQRSTRGVGLTDAGTRFMHDCLRLLEAVEHAEASAKGLHSRAQGAVSVLFPLLFSRHLMAPMLAAYLQQFPDIQLSAHYHDRYPNMIEEGLDVAVLIGDLPSSSWVARPVGQVRTLVCASPGYLDAHGEPQSPDDLRRHHLVAIQAYPDWVQWDFAGGTVKARARLNCATVQSAISAAVHGAGMVRCLSYPLHDYLVNGQLRRVLQAYEPAAVPVHVVFREGRHASMRVRSFVDFIVAGLREHPAFQLA